MRRLSFKRLKRMSLFHLVSLVAFTEMMHLRRQTAAPMRMVLSLKVYSVQSQRMLRRHHGNACVRKQDTGTILGDTAQSWFGTLKLDIKA
ncbi:hypothetical protein PF004_g7506 [Phytophthora fragariae]|uniref:Secreted protein n=1 Tax=Phytophthora fragariae TaxID=53985 RepID=A0A6G0P9P7_9STRA|nr:hypothetical protein PF004_g7506 [Phytophthora fragariae]